MTRCDCCRKEIEKPLNKRGKKFCCDECVKAATGKKSKSEVCEFC